MSAPDPLAQASALLQRRDLAGAYRLLAEASNAGHARAAAELADWRMSGQLIRRDLTAARELYGRAADLGLDAARPVQIALMANGAGGTSPRQWQAALGLLRQRAKSDHLAVRQIALIDAMAIDEAGDPLSLPTFETASAEPLIRRCPQFMTAEECRYVADLALPAIQPAVVVHPQTGQFIRDPVRQSGTASFALVEEDPVLHALNRRIARATATDYAQGEPMQVLSYHPGEHYKLHSDALPPGHNQRTDTFLVTLSTQFEGGATSFPKLGLDLRGTLGEAFHFRNVDAQGQPEPLAWHAGSPVTSGRKLLLSRWIRQEPLDLSGPPGRPF